MPGAHVAGHSYGGVTALQLAQDAPAAVHSLVLLETALLNVPSGPAFGEAAGPVVAAFEAGDVEKAVTGFMNIVFSEPNWRGRIERHLPKGYWEQTLADVDTFFKVEFPALGDWLFTGAEARTVAVPVLSVVGAESSPTFVEGQALMKSWWPSLATATIPGASHNLQFANPSGVAAARASFLVRHPLEA